MQILYRNWQKSFGHILDIADEYLQDMIGQTKLDYRDFCIEEDDIEVFLESITDSNLAPVIYMNHAADEKYTERPFVTGDQ